MERMRTCNDEIYQLVKDLGLFVYEQIQNKWLLLLYLSNFLIFMILLDLNSSKDL
jgi:hypothetical protein